MNDKCDAHDSCIGRIRDDVGSFREDLHTLGVELKELLHAASLSGAMLAMRVERCENEISSLKQGRGVDWRGLAASMCFGLVEKGILVILAMAYYAHKSGFGE